MPPHTDLVLSAPAPDTPPPASEPRKKIEVVLFSGGSGTQSITETLRQHPQISLRILINAYDDGHSTGRLRRFIPGMLGPSDVRKNINRLMGVSERSEKSLQAISDYRLPVGIARESALRQIDGIVEGNVSQLPAKLADAFPKLACWQAGQLKSYLETFRAYFDEQEKAGRSFDFTDCALGNLLFAGCYLEQSRDFNRTIDAFSEFYEVPRGVLLNVTLGENLFLVAEKESGAVLLNEADIVKLQDSAKIEELFLIDQETYLGRIENAQEPADGWGPLLRAAHRVPHMNPRAMAAIAAADVIIYGPGTQHSSLLPSYLTEGVAETIAANTKADKVFIGNIHRDFDIQADDAGDLARKLLYAMNRKGQASVGWLDVVSHFFVQGVDENTLNQAKYVPFDQTRFNFPLETVRVRDWEAQEGRHSGGYVLDELRQIVQSRIDIELAQVHHMVSIVVPVLNEEATVEQVLKAVTALDFQDMGLSKEVLLVDGGSTDHTLERAKGVRSVRVYSLTAGHGRGAAMRLGVEKARGNLVVFFPGDDEYRPEDVKGVVRTLLNSGFRAVFGTRATKCTDLSNQLKAIYGNNRKLYLTSKYGGMLLSVTTLLLYNRYVTDVLSSLKGYDLQLLRSLQLESEGLDLETEIVAKLSRRREYMFEMPVDYKPRTRASGKKIRSSDGLKALLALVRFRLRSQPATGNEAA
ncbi:MAG TPA: 2-phospho-L-lactate transferase CofD family protein [Bryobacteraceae bacterium]|jgi:2-phospho-L-lactate transferase/gluconeogenesis factor (CofD/UPF0052 family)|nr:2-phospho-L-lactate transferase CofD family protein [Bryobacteraceae bacterium]